MVKNGPAVSEKMTLGLGQEMTLTFNTHIPSVTQLVARPEETFVSPTHGVSTQNLALIGRAVSEKMFEFVGDDGRRINATHGSGELKETIQIVIKVSAISLEKNQFRHLHT